MHDPLASVQFEEAKRVRVGDILIVIGGIDLEGDQELAVAYGKRMCVQMPALSAGIVHIAALGNPEMPAGFGSALNEHAPASD